MKAFWIRSLLPALLLVFLTAGLCFAELPLPSAETLNVPVPEGENFFDQTDSVMGPAMRLVRILLGAIAVLLIVVSGFSMVLNAEKEDEVSEKKKGILWGMIGLLLLSAAGPLASIFDYRAGNFVADTNALGERIVLFSATTGMFLTFLKVTLGSVATVFMVRAGGALVMNGDEEEVVTREKANLALGAGGLLLLMFADLIVNRILYNVTLDAKNGAEVNLDPNSLLSQMAGLVNLLLTFVGPVLVLFLVAGGVMYTVSLGDEGRQGIAKAVIKNSIIGMVIIYGSYAIITTVIAGRF